MALHGVFINILLNGILEITSAIRISEFKHKFNTIANSLAKLNEIKDTNIVTNPNIIIIPNIGLANILEIKNVNEIVLNLYAIIGIIIICAEIVTDKSFDILLFILTLFKKFSTFLLNSIIPIVPK